MLQVYSKLSVNGRLQSHIYSFGSTLPARPLPLQLLLLLLPAGGHDWWGEHTECWQNLESHKWSHAQLILRQQRALQCPH
jgi:hypothetical protein